MRRQSLLRRTILLVASAFVLLFFLPPWHDQPPVLSRLHLLDEHAELDQTMRAISEAIKPEKTSLPNTLPPVVQLSHGVNKYVLVTAHEKQDAQNNSPIRRQLWFVKSATPQECGGPYHRFVARELVQQLRSLGWETSVTGGGRIDYDATTKQARVYGYSNQYGRGDHVLVAKLIAEHSDIKATYDLSESLY